MFKSLSTSPFPPKTVHNEFSKSTRSSLGRILQFKLDCLLEFKLDELIDAISDVSMLLRFLCGYRSKYDDRLDDLVDVGVGGKGRLGG